MPLIFVPSLRKREIGERAEQKEERESRAERGESRAVRGEREIKRHRERKLKIAG